MTIEVRSLTKSYDARAVLAGVSLAFEPGAVTSVLGPSGCGKSTLLRCINGLEEFERGEIAAFGEVLGPKGHPDRPRVLRAVRAKVGFVFQQWNLFSHRTALANVMEAPVHVKRVPSAQARERAESLLASVGLAHRAGAYPHEMSGGEQQRVAIARALAMDPEVLLLDEPTSALDPERKGEVLAVLRTLARGGMTMVLVTHEIAFAREVSQRVLVLHEGGKILEDGAPAEVLSRPRDARTRAFLGSYAQGDGRTGDDPPVLPPSL